MAPLRDLAVPPPLDPMLATLARELPVGAYAYEPKWDGFRALAFVHGGDTLLSSRNRRPLDRYFPEVVEGLLAVGRRVDGAGIGFVLDGEIVASGPAGLDFASLMLRLHPSRSRVERLRVETPAAFVAFDLLAVGGRDLRRDRQAERRDRLAGLLADAPPTIAVTPVTDDPAAAGDWLDRFQGGGLDGVVAKEVDSPYEAGRRSRCWRKVKTERTADCVVGGFRVAGPPDAPAVASLLLGLCDAGGHLRHVGVVASFPAARRRQLVEELRAHVAPLAGHPWAGGFALERGPMGRLRGAGSAWDPAYMDLDWVPLRPDLVCEVAYDQVDASGRWRHPARFRRWRPDRSPASCTVDQLAFDPPDLSRILGERA